MGLIGRGIRDECLLACRTHFVSTPLGAYVIIYFRQAPRFCSLRIFSTASCLPISVLALGSVYRRGATVTAAPLPPAVVMPIILNGYSFTI